jgi:hypothetical protein
VAGIVLVAVAAGLAVWLADGGGSSPTATPKDDPVLFLRGVVRQLAANDYEHAWLKLHPAQQRVATQKVYVQCEQLSPIPGHLDSIELLGSKQEKISVPGDKGTVTSTAATFRLTITEPSLKMSVPVTVTAHAVPVEGQWRWILTAKRFASYRAKQCPGFEPAPTEGPSSA